jgi:hypothetical protein
VSFSGLLMMIGGKITRVYWISRWAIDVGTDASSEIEYEHRREGSGRSALSRCSVLRDPARRRAESVARPGMAARARGRGEPLGTEVASKALRGL